MRVKQGNNVKRFVEPLLALKVNQKKKKKSTGEHVNMYFEIADK